MNENQQAPVAVPDTVPTYKHDCERCVFLGPYTFEGTTYDLYFCPQLPNLPTVIARFGDDGPDYMSGLEFGKQEALAGAVRPMGVAYMRAVSRNLITPEW